MDVSTQSLVDAKRTPASLRRSHKLRTCLDNL